MERIVRSTHDADEWTHVISRMSGYGAVSQPIKPQRMLDTTRVGHAGAIPQDGRLSRDHQSELGRQMAIRAEDAAAPKGRDTRAIVTQYDMVRPTTEPHDILVDKDGNVWYTDFGEMFIGKFDPKTLKLTEYPIKKFKDKAPTGLLSIEFDHDRQDLVRHDVPGLTRPPGPEDRRDCLLSAASGIQRRHACS